MVTKGYGQVSAGFLFIVLVSVATVAADSPQIIPGAGAIQSGIDAAPDRDTIAGLPAGTAAPETRHDSWRVIA